MYIFPACVAGSTKGTIPVAALKFLNHSRAVASLSASAASSQWDASALSRLAAASFCRFVAALSKLLVCRRPSGMASPLSLKSRLALAAGSSAASFAVAPRFFDERGVGGLGDSWLIEVAPFMRLSYVGTCGPDPAARLVVVRSSPI